MTFHTIKTTNIKNFYSHKQVIKTKLTKYTRAVQGSSSGQPIMGSNLMGSNQNKDRNIRAGFELTQPTDCVHLMLNKYWKWILVSPLMVFDVHDLPFKDNYFTCNGLNKYITKQEKKTPCT